MPTHYDTPLNITDVNDPLENALPILAARVIHHLDGDWGIERSTGGAILVGPDEERVLFSMYGVDYDPHKFYIRTFTPTGRPTVKGDWVNIFMLPAQVAAHLEADTLPKTRKRLASARKQQAIREADQRPAQGTYRRHRQGPGLELQQLQGPLPRPLRQPPAPDRQAPGTRRGAAQTQRLRRLRRRRHHECPPGRIA